MSGRWLLLFLLGVVTVTSALALLRGSPTPKPAEATPVLVTRDLQYHPSAQLDVYRVEDPRNLPVMVMLHGCCGGREDLFQLAYEFASRNVLVFNAGWTPTPAGGGYPDVYEQAACALRFARSSAASFGGDSSTVALLGFSDGALIGAAATLATPEFDGDCVQSGPSKPDLFIGVSGFYGWEPGGLGSVGRSSEMDDFFGGSPLAAPSAWARGNPYHLLSAASPSSLLLIAGEEDPLSADAACFYLALVEAGHTSRLEIVSEAGHLELISPRSRAGRSVVGATLSAMIDADFRTDPESPNHCSTPRSDGVTED